MLGDDLTGAAVQVGAHAQGEISVARALELAAQLADIANGLRLDVAAQEARERELIGWLVRYLVSDTRWHREHADTREEQEHGIPLRVRSMLEQDDDLARAFYAAMAEAEERDRAEMGGDDDLPF